MAPLQQACREPIHDVHPLTGISIEVFYADRTLETFGRCGSGWFWWPRRRGFSPDGPATGPFATSYSAYRHAVTAPNAHRSVTMHGASARSERPADYAANTRYDELLMTEDHAALLEPEWNLLKADTIAAPSHLLKS